MTLTDPEKAANSAFATTPKPGTPDGQVEPARASGEVEAPALKTEVEEHADDAESEDTSNYPTGLPLAIITDRKSVV